MSDAIRTRVGLNTRIREELDREQARGNLLWGLSESTTGALQYHIEQAGEVYFFSPGRCATWLGLDV